MDSSERETTHCYIPLFKLEKLLWGRPTIGDGQKNDETHLSDGLRRHPAERHQQPLLRLEVVLLVGRAVAPEITDFDMITFANQAVPVRRLGDQFNPQTHSILTSAP